jgi:hypothetical protein
MNLTTEDLLERSEAAIRRGLAEAEAALSAPPPEPELLQGAAEIGAFLGCTAARAQYLLERGELPAFKLAGRWCMRPSAFRAFCEKREAGDGS